MTSFRPFSLARNAGTFFVLLGFLASFFRPQAAQAAGSIRFVTPTGKTSGSCDTWANACKLQFALGITDAGEELWLKKGVYRPGATQTISFVVPAGVRLYGGFAGIETQVTERDPRLNVTILSGDVDSDDTNADGNHIAESHTHIQGSNSDHVVLMDSTAADITNDTVLDGLTITAGESDGTLQQGGGLICMATAPGDLCSPTISNVTFSGNTAYHGGALNAFASVAGAESSPLIVNSTFRGNWAQFGGAIFSRGDAGVSNSVIANTTFQGNSSASWGGAIANYAVSGGSASPQLTNVTFSQNTAQDGGAVYNFEGPSSSSDTVFTNVILWGDAAASSGNEVYNFDAEPSMTYSVVQGGCAGIGGTVCGSGNLSTDPFLLPLGDYGGSTRTMPISGASSALNNGDPNACLAAPVYGVDQRGNSRPEGPGCDIGATESPIVTLTYKSQGANDGWVREGSADSGTGGLTNSGATTLRLGDDGADREYRSILSFRTASLPPDVQIVSLTLKIREAGWVGSDPFVDQGDLLVDMQNGYIGSGQQVKHTDFDYVMSVEDGYSIPYSATWLTGILPPIYFDAVNDAGLTQFRLHFSTGDNNNMTAEFMKFFSGDAGKSKRPQLLVEHYRP